jgi:heat-inducible transcriptional repressor
VLAELEERGLLTHPHTSAGRLPTETGLRLFVDGIMQAHLPSAEERAAIERQVHDRPLEEALANATAALSGLSACAGVVVAPKIERRLRQLAFVPLGQGQALAILVGDDGSVENRMVSLPPGLTAAALSEIAAFVTARLAGLTLFEAEARLRQEIRERREALDAAAAELVATGLAEWREDGPARPILIVRRTGKSARRRGGP